MGHPSRRGADRGPARRGVPCRRPERRTTAPRRRARGSPPLPRQRKALRVDHLADAGAARGPQRGRRRQSAIGVGTFGREAASFTVSRPKVHDGRSVRQPGKGGSLPPVPLGATSPLRNQATPPSPASGRAFRDPVHIGAGGAAPACLPEPVCARGGEHFSQAAGSFLPTWCPRGEPSQSSDAFGDWLGGFV